MISLRLLVAAASGAILTAALPPTGAWPLLVALVPPFALAAASGHPRAAFRVGFATGLGFFSLYILWLPASFAQPEFFGPWFWLVYPPLVLLLGAFWGLVVLAARALGGPGRGTLLLLPPLWVLMEWARTQGYFAFPWGTLGYAWLDTPAGQLADTVGTYGLSLLSCAAAALLASPFVPAPPRALGRGNPAARVAGPLAAAALVGLAWLAGGTKLDRPLPAPTHTAVLVQGNIDPFGRLTTPAGEVRIQERLTREAVAALPAPPDLVVWPEGAVMSVNLEGSGAGQALAQIQASAPGSTFIVGGRARAGGRSYNSAYVIEGGVITDRYDKVYLVPFGERFPLIETLAPLYRGVFGLFGLPLLESTSPGEGPVPLELPASGSASAVYICYESVFPQVQGAMVRAGAPLLVNITNDAWFARGNGARQHYDMGRMRAIETRRYLLRAGLDGITGVVDPLGRSVAELPRGVADTLTVRYALLDGLTPWVRYGQWLVPALLAWVLVALPLRSARR